MLDVYNELRNIYATCSLVLALMCEKKIEVPDGDTAMKRDETYGYGAC